MVDLTGPPYFCAFISSVGFTTFVHEDMPLMPRNLMAADNDKTVTGKSTHLLQKRKKISIEKARNMCISQSIYLCCYNMPEIIVVFFGSTVQSDASQSMLPLLEEEVFVEDESTGETTTIVMLEFCINPLLPKSDLKILLSNARRFYSSKGDPLGFKGLKLTDSTMCY